MLWFPFIHEYSKRELSYLKEICHYCMLQRIYNKYRSLWRSDNELQGIWSLHSCLRRTTQRLFCIFMANVPQISIKFAFSDFTHQREWTMIRVLSPYMIRFLKSFTFTLVNIIKPRPNSDFARQPCCFTRLNKRCRVVKIQHGSKFLGETHRQTDGRYNIK